MADLDTLIGDDERSAAERDLRRHYDSGRLTLEEFESRLAEVHGARTAANLEEALRRLPELRRPTLSVRDARWSSLVLQYALVNVVAVLVWLFSGAQDGFWPKWMFLATLLMVVRRTGRRRRRAELRSSRETNP